LLRRKYDRFTSESLSESKTEESKL
jgi:hypothetical protein